jgi:hypothetical protein
LFYRILLNTSTSSSLSRSEDVAVVDL